MNQKDLVYNKYKNSTNMSYSELKNWSQNPCSYKASIGRTAINRNLNLLSTPKSQWTDRDITEANKAISYLARAKTIKSNNNVPGCDMTKNEIALKNWAYKK